MSDKIMKLKQTTCVCPVHGNVGNTKMNISVWGEHQYNKDFCVLCLGEQLEKLGVSVLEEVVK